MLQIVWMPFLGCHSAHCTLSSFSSFLEAESCFREIFYTPRSRLLLTQCCFFLLFTCVIAPILRLRLTLHLAILWLLLQNSLGISTPCTLAGLSGNTKSISFFVVPSGHLHDHIIFLHLYNNVYMNHWLFISARSTSVSPPLLRLCIRKRPTDTSHICSLPTFALVDNSDRKCCFFLSCWFHNLEKNA